MAATGGSKHTPGRGILFLAANDFAQSSALRGSAP